MHLRFSLGVLTFYFDRGVSPRPVSESLSLVSGLTLSAEYHAMAAAALALVEVRELDQDTLNKIDQLGIDIANLGNRISALQTERLQQWRAYCDATFTALGDLAVLAHWSAGQVSTAEIRTLQEEQFRKLALQTALRQRQYTNPDHREVADTYARILSSASRIRLPRYPDPEYKEEAEKFSPIYFASLPDSESPIYTNNYLFTAPLSVDMILSSQSGSFTNTVEKRSSASSDIIRDWNASGRVGYGPFSVRAAAESHTQIKEDFKHVQSISVGVRSLLRVDIAAGSWFNPGLFRNSLVRENEGAFRRFLDQDGSLLYYPSALIVARGLKVVFHSSQNWTYDYKKQLQQSGGASAKIFGISFGGRARSSAQETRQNVEVRGNDLILDDGEDSIRIIGYAVTKNEGFEALRVEALRSEFETLSRFTAPMPEM